VAELSGLTLAEAVDDVLDIGRNGDPQLPSQFQAAAPNDSWGQYVDACNWWIDAMVNRPRPFVEKMTLFWHGHFVSSWWDVDQGYQMMLQNQLYRNMALGDFVALAQAMALQPAMLVYLSNAVNVKGAPNQNFARELMELFLLGVGNYTEADVEAAALAWTGYNYNWDTEQYVYRPTKHHTGASTFFGVTKVWSGPQIIDEILVNNSQKRLVAARLISRKLWEFLAHPGPPPGVVDALAEVFVSSGMQLKPLLRALLNRPEFYSTTAKQGLVRSPIEWFVALCAHTGLTPDELGVAWRGEMMGQSIFNPPNVAGWKQNGYWLNTSAISGRAGLARNITWTLRSGGGFNDLNDLTVAAAVDRVAEYFGIVPLSDVTRAALTSAQTAERASTAWKNYWSPTNLLTMAMLTPEMHLA
jgi:uncharacterized protein (DUF1800 family)